MANRSRIGGEFKVPTPVVEQTAPHAPAELPTDAFYSASAQPLLQPPVASPLRVPPAIDKFMTIAADIAPAPAHSAGTLPSDVAGPVLKAIKQDPDAVHKDMTQRISAFQDDVKTWWSSWAGRAGATQDALADIAQKTQSAKGNPDKLAEQLKRLHALEKEHSKTPLADAILARQLRQHAQTLGIKDMNLDHPALDASQVSKVPEASDQVAQGLVRVKTAIAQKLFEEKLLRHSAPEAFNALLNESPHAAAWLLADQAKQHEERLRIWADHNSEDLMGHIPDQEATAEADALADLRKNLLSHEQTSEQIQNALAQLPNFDKAAAQLKEQVDLRTQLRLAQARHPKATPFQALAEENARQALDVLKRRAERLGADIGDDPRIALIRNFKPEDLGQPTDLLPGEVDTQDNLQQLAVGQLMSLESKLEEAEQAHNKKSTQAVLKDLQRGVGHVDDVAAKVDLAVPSSGLFDSVTALLGRAVLDKGDQLNVLSESFKQKLRAKTFDQMLTGVQTETLERKSLQRTLDLGSAEELIYRLEQAGRGDLAAQMLAALQDPVKNPDGNNTRTVMQPFLAQLAQLNGPAKEAYLNYRSDMRYKNQLFAPIFSWAGRVGIDLLKDSARRGQFEGIVRQDGFNRVLAAANDMADAIKTPQVTDPVSMQVAYDNNLREAAESIVNAAAPKTGSLRNRLVRFLARYGLEQFYLKTLSSKIPEGNVRSQMYLNPTVDVLQSLMPAGVDLTQGTNNEKLARKVAVSAFLKTLAQEMEHVPTDSVDTAKESVKSKAELARAAKNSNLDAFLSGRLSRLLAGRRASILDWVAGPDDKAALGPEAYARFKPHFEDFRAQYPDQARMPQLLPLVAEGKYLDAALLLRRQIQLLQQSGNAEPNAILALEEMRKFNQQMGGVVSSVVSQAHSGFMSEALAPWLRGEHF